MQPKNPPIDLVKQHEWKIVDFVLNKDNFEAFLSTLVEFNTTDNKQKLLHDNQNSQQGVTIEEINYLPYLWPVYSMFLMHHLISYSGYIIKNGAATRNDELILFSIRPTKYDSFNVSGVSNALVLDYFTALLAEIHTKFEETRFEINEYLKRVELIKLNNSDTSGSNRSVNSEIKNSSKKPRQPRRDALLRVAVSLFYFEIGEIRSKISAAERFHTNTPTINKYESHPTVAKYLEEMRSDRRIADRYRQQISKKSKIS